MDRLYLIRHGETEGGEDYGCMNIIEFWDRYPVIKLMNYSLIA